MLQHFLQHIAPYVAGPTAHVAAFFAAKGPICGANVYT
jgi:hypothetical protein